MYVKLNKIKNYPKINSVFNLFNYCADPKNKECEAIIHTSLTHV